MFFNLVLTMDLMTQTDSQDDVFVVGEVLKGRTASFNILVNRYQRLVRIAVWNYFGRDEFVDDLCQETFLKAFSSLSSLKDPRKTKRWILQIAFRLCIDFQKRNRIETLYLDKVKGPEEGTFPRSDGVEPRFDENSILGFLNQLSPIDCLVVWLRYIEELSYGDIATVTDLTEVAIRQRTSRAMKTMRERIK